jgi:pyridoxal phosphate phosphatase PHOSPHO2
MDRPQTALATVVFDYDLSLIDTNSDTFVPGELAPPLLEHIRARHREGALWTSLMAEVLRMLHAGGAARADVERALERMPVWPETLALVREARARGHPLDIVSDANEVYIGHFLAHHGVQQAFSRVVTNRATFTADGLLEVAPYHDEAALGPHGCARCPPNLCKGRVMDALGHSVADGTAANAGAAAGAAAGEADGAAAVARAPVAYVGDGGGDVCAALRLGPRDLVAARAGFPLDKALRAPEVAALLRARVETWADGPSLRAVVGAFIGL